MGITARKEIRANGAVYYKAYDVKRVNGEVVQK